MVRVVGRSLRRVSLEEGRVAWLSETGDSDDTRVWMLCLEVVSDRRTPIGTTGEVSSKRSQVTWFQHLHMPVVHRALASLHFWHS